MADRSADYRINRTVLGVTYANITKMNVEALVSSDDTELAMAGGVSLAILLATGERLMEEVRKHAPLRVGEVAVTSAGDHSAKYVFHAAMIDYAKMVFPDDAIVARATGRCLELADALHLRTIAFPALGTGVGQFPFQRAAEAMTRTLTEYLSKGSDIDHVSLCLFGRRGQATDDKDLFYERAIGLAAIAEQGRSLRSVLVGLQNAVVATGRPDLVQEMGDLARRLQQADDVLQQSADTTESLSALEARSGIGPISEGLVALSTDVEEQSGHVRDRHAQTAVLRTRLQGLLTQLNIQTANLNKLEIQKAKHGIDVPLSLENAIEDTRNQIADLEARVDETSKRLAPLASSEIG